MSRWATASLGAALQVLRKADRPAILVGPCARAEARLVSELARRLGAAILTTPDAKSIVDESSPYSAGVFSFGASDRAIAVADAADALLAIATNLGEFATRGGKAFARAPIVHVTDNPKDVPMGVHPAVSIVGDVEATLRSVVDGLPRRDRVPLWFDRFCASEIPADRPSPRGAMHPIDAVRAMGAALPQHARIACDITSGALHLLRTLKLRPNSDSGCRSKRAPAWGARFRPDSGFAWRATCRR